MTELWHLADGPDWGEAARTGSYERSTRGLSLAEVGFVHCSYPHQAAGVAAAFYADAAEVVLLRIDPARVRAEIRVEGGFPHVYGPIPVAAVTSADPLTRDATGRRRDGEQGQQGGPFPASACRRRSHPLGAAGAGPGAGRRLRARGPLGC